MVASRTSAAVRAMIPWHDIVAERSARSPGALRLKTGTRKLLGFTVVVPWAKEGNRRDPPMSFP